MNNNDDFPPFGRPGRARPRAAYPQVDSAASLGDILRHALNPENYTTMPKQEDLLTVETKEEVPNHFPEVRTFSPHRNLIQRIKDYRTRHGCTLTEAKRQVEIKMLMEMLDQAQTMDEVKQAREWARGRFHYLGEG